MAELENKDEIIEETAETEMPKAEESSVAEETSVVEEKSAAEEKAGQGAPAIAKIRRGIINFLWVFPIIFLALSVLLVYKFGQNLFTLFDYSLQTKTIENIAYNIQDLFIDGNPSTILPTVTFLIVAVIYVVFTIICVIRVIGFIFGIFGLLGKDEEKKIKKFGKLSRSFLASYGLYFELLLLVRMGDYTWLSGGKSVIITTCVAYFAIAIVWQLVSAEDRNAFKWKDECFKLIRALIRPALAVLLAIYAIPAWSTWVLNTVSAGIASGSGMPKELIIPLSATSVCGIVETIVLAIMVKKTFKNGAVRIKKSETKWTKDPDDTLLADSTVFLIFALIKAVGMALGGVLVGEGFDTAIFMSEIKALIIPILIFLSIISLTKVAAPSKKQ